MPHVSHSRLKDEQAGLDGCSTQLWLISCRYCREGAGGAPRVQVINRRESTPVQVVSTTRRIAAPLILAAALFAFAAGSAHASLPPVDGASCSDYSYSQVFLPWADPANYTLVPSGDFENSASHWTLIGASRDTGDNEPWHVADSNDHSSLKISDGGSAISPAMCVGLEQPTLRMFFKQTAGLPALDRLRVDVLFDDVTGSTQSQSIGWVGAVQGWSPSQQMAVVANLLPALDVGSAVEFRFTAIGGSFAIDDVYVDPWGKG